ncbi:MAG: MATE family efflux transporter [Candidatus Sericytochromatia bacterium]
MPRTAELELSVAPQASRRELLGNIWQLALPAMGASGVQIVFDLTHAFWVGRLGPVKLAALTGASFLVWILFSLTMMLNTGFTALIARRIGAGDTPAAMRHARQGLLLAPLAGLMLMILTLPLLPPVLAWMGFEPEARLSAWAYLHALGLGLPVIWTYSMLQAIFVGRGDTRSSLRMVSLALLLNLLLDPVLINLAGLGLRGAAVASLIARAAGIAWGLWYLASLGWLGLERPERRLTLQALRIGLPHAATGVIFCMVFVGLTPILTHFGSPALAAMGIGQRLETVIFSVLSGLAVACTTLVGQNLGARRPDRAESLVWLAAGQAAAFCACLMVVFWLAAPLVVPLFSQDTLTQEYGIAYLRTVSLTLVPYSCEMVFEGAFAGAGNTLPPMLIITLGTLIRIPLALFFAFTCQLGVAGVWMAVATSMTLKGCILLLWFRRGHWKEVLI